MSPDLHISGGSTGYHVYCVVVLLRILTTSTAQRVRSTAFFCHRLSKNSQKYFQNLYTTEKAVEKNPLMYIVVYYMHIR